jgi:hypothetical protein
MQPEFRLRLATFAVGVALLLAGAVWLDYPDWDIGISMLMAFATFATATWVTGVFWQRRWKWMPLALFWTWFSVDGVYWAYWSVVRPEAMIRAGQWPASLCLYGLCGIIWYRLIPAVVYFWRKN